MITINSIVCNPFQECCYVLWSESKAAAVIDCGCYCAEEQQALRTLVEREGLHIVAHLATHAHLDHLFGAAWLYRTYGVPVTIHEADIPLAKQLPTQGNAFGFLWKDWDFPIEVLPTDTDMLSLPDLPTIQVLHTPGHSRGSVCYFLPEEKVLFSGDTAFHGGGYGRTDLWGGDYSALMQSLERLRQLPAGTRLYPGH